MSPDETENQDLTLHKLATIAFVQSFGNGRREYFFYRRDMSKKSLKNMVEEFVDQMQQSQKEMMKLLPNSIEAGIESYSKMVNQKEFKKLPPEVKAAAYRKLSYLRNISRLPVYSWNGEKYDLNVLLGPLIEAFARNERLFKNMNIIKRGTSFMEIQYGPITLRDFLNYTSPMKLSKKKNLNFFIFIYYKLISFILGKFAKSNKIEELEKGTFPYELWTNIEDIRKCETFPSYEKFASSLMKPDKGHVDELVEIIKSRIQSGQLQSIK